MNFRLFMIVLTAFALGLVGAAFTFAMLAGRDASRTITTGEARIGGPFALTDHTGKRLTDQDFRGRHMLVFFGFAYCPDICPSELQIMAAALDRLGPAGDKVQPVFITVDPERDTPEKLAAFVGNFHPRLVGLTGSAEEIAAAARAYRVYYARAKDAASAADYLIDHSAFVYLMGPDGKYLTHFAYGVSPERMADGIRAYVGN